MKVRDLIKKLQLVDQDAEFLTPAPEFGWNQTGDYLYVSEVKKNENKPNWKHGDYEVIESTVNNAAESGKTLGVYLQRRYF